MKQKQASVKDGYIPTVKELEENKKFIEKCLHYGIRVDTFSKDVVYSNDELVALNYINSGRDVPDDLAQRLLNTKESRQKNGLNTENIAKESDVKELFGIDLK